MIDLTNDLHFKYVLTAKGDESRISLEGITEAFTQRKTRNLTVKSPEIICGDSYQKSTRFDIYASFDDNSNIDIEMQVVDNEKELVQRMIYYHSRIVTSQLGHGDEYTALGEAYILFICNFKYVNDKDLVHQYTLKDKNGISLCKDGKEYVNMITVELPKLNGNVYPESIMEKYAYVIKYSSNESKHDIIEKITEEEKEWMKSFNRDRARLDENQRVVNAREKGRAEGEFNKEKEMILSLYKLNVDISTIAKASNKEVDYVLQIIDENK